MYNLHFHLSPRDFSTLKRVEINFNLSSESSFKDNILTLKEGDNTLESVDLDMELLERAVSELEKTHHVNLHFSYKLNAESILNFKLFLRSDLYKWISQQQDATFRSWSVRLGYADNTIFLNNCAKGRQIDLKQRFREHELEDLSSKMPKFKEMLVYLKEMFLEDTDQIDVSKWTIV